MILITERPSLNKIKMFFCNGDCNQFIYNLKVNRNIPDTDLNVYKVTDGTKFLCDSYNYSIDNNVVTIYKEVATDVYYSQYAHWSNMTSEQIESAYTQDEQNKIQELVQRYTVGVIQAMVAGQIPFPSDFSIFDGVYVDLPPKPVSYAQEENQPIPCQFINVEAI